ncbi:RNA polymerase sigma factor [Paenibacillus sp. LHD-38]|uniref:RNA polymerase sigma factor n=1 Tax=Paenibacillus sp. LHD-38 TaxID=3072143 RepID=UPI00280C749D|nr:RNA polymerase sigma factor [Paenibacillus sp. LHD-38]MDQ8733620.1 RNA polymerase sigma factor [Paenibacillus sp. LHD-38]
MHIVKALPSNEVHPSEIQIERLYAVLYRYCMSLTKSKWDAEDLVQDTWLKSMRAALYTTHKNPEALMLRIAKNTWIDQLRRKNQFHLILQQGMQMEAVSDTSSLDHEASLYGLIQHLSPLQLAVFLLRDVFEYTAAETAELLQTSTGAIKAALHRAREALHAVRRELESEVLNCPNEEDMKSYLSALAMAYELGDVALLIELAQRDISEAAMVIGIAQNAKLRAVSRKGQPRINSQSTLQMAA